MADARKEYTFTVVVVPEEPEFGGYVVEVPALSGCLSQGETVEEALAMIRDAMEVWIEATRRCSEIPADRNPEDLEEGARVFRVTVTV